MKPQFAVRADHEKRIYEVYEIQTGKTIERFRYKARSESSRGIAHGRANISRDTRNRAISPWSKLGVVVPPTIQK